MNRKYGYLLRLRDDQRGHAMVGLPSLVAAIAAITLGFGAAGDTDWLTIGSSFVLGVGIFLTGLARHRGIDEVYSRLEKVESGQTTG
jgi:hypothetical protein